jgi:RNA polymerase primary sigma factor
MERYRAELPNNILSRDLYVIEEYLELYQNIKGMRKASYSKIKISDSQLLHFLRTGELKSKAGRNEKKLSLIERVAHQVEFYEINNKMRFPDEVLDRYGFRRAELEKLISKEPELRIVSGKSKAKQEYEPPDRFESDSYRQYMIEAGSHPILTREEEIELVKRVRQGDEQARKELVLKNQRLIFSIIKLFEYSGMDKLDLVQYGNLGLIKAAEKFDLLHRTKFCTYATWWIKQVIRRGIASQKKDIRIPAYMRERISRLNRINIKYLASKGRSPTFKEIYNETGWDKKQVNLIIKSSSIEVSSNSPIVGGESLDELVAAEGRNKEVLSGRLWDIYNTLTEREKEIIKRRYGIGCDPETLEAVGKRLDITRERVRQIEDEALDKFRHEFGVPTKRVDFPDGKRRLKKEYLYVKNKKRRARKNK